MSSARAARPDRGDPRRGDARRRHWADRVATLMIRLGPETLIDGTRKLARPSIPVGTAPAAAPSGDHGARHRRRRDDPSRRRAREGLIGSRRHRAAGHGRDLGGERYPRSAERRAARTPSAVCRRGAGRVAAHAGSALRSASAPDGGSWRAGFRCTRCLLLRRRPRRGRWESGGSGNASSRPSKLKLAEGRGARARACPRRRADGRGRPGTFAAKQTEYSSRAPPLGGEQHSRSPREQFGLEAWFDPARRRAPWPRRAA